MNETSLFFDAAIDGSPIDSYNGEDNQIAFSKRPIS